LASNAWANLSTSAQTLTKAAQEWAQSQSPESSAEVRLAPLDARVSIVECGAGWQFDLPYASRETLRARCDQPRQQLFLRIQPSGPMKAPSRAELNASTSPGSSAAGPMQRVALQASSPPQGADRPADSTTKNPSPFAGSRLVLQRDLPRGARLSADLVEKLEPDPEATPQGVPEGPRLPLSNLPQIKELKALEFMELTRPMRAGETLRSTDLKPAVLVRRGQSVTMKFGASGQFSVEVRLESLQDGQHGDRIRLKNQESGRILNGRVIGDLAVLPD
jgi:flagella basal body P-ring formation protein FlgA